jgi:hypothetical protein
MSIAENGRSIDAAGCNLGMCSQNFLRALQRSRALGLEWGAGRFQEVRHRIGGGRTPVRQRYDVFRKLRPAFETVLAGNDNLSVGQREPGFQNIGIEKLARMGMGFPDAKKRIGIAGLESFD